MDEYGEEKRNMTFVTDGTGRDNLIISFDGIDPGEYALRVEPDDTWRQRSYVSEDIMFVVNKSDTVIIDGKDIRLLDLTTSS